MAGPVIACAIPLLAAPTTGAAGVSVETPRGHAREDNVALSPGTEARLGRETTEKTAAAAAKAAAETSGDPGQVGQWGPVVEWPIVAVHATVLPSGKVLAYASVGEHATETYPEQNHTEATVWDPATGSQTNVTLNDGFNIFCSGLAQMTDGNLFIAGGNKDQQLDGIVQTHVFDWENETWSQGMNMSYARWYPSVTPMGNGEMLITSGGPPIPEVRQNDGTLRQLSNASLSLPLYPWFDVAPDGRAFDSGPDETMRSLDPSGAGSWQLWGNRDSINRSYGSHAMYDIGKILVAGGGPSTNTADVIDLNGPTPTVTPTGSMAYGRRQNNLTVLADGTVLVTGGNSSGAELVDLNAGVYPAELWSPATGQWTTLASMRVTRQYHSTALLLPDGRVLSAGGGICGICDEVGYINKNAEIFSPPYLFAKDGSGALAPRPTVSAAPGTVTEGTQFSVSTPDAASIQKVALVRLGAVTHSNNMEQRYVPLRFEAASGSLTVTAPASVNIAPPGYYMLFIVNSAGVPSVAPIVRVAPPEPPPPPSGEIPDPTAGGWTLNGSAALSGSELTLTQAVNDQAGSAFWPQPIDPRNMTVEFDATIGGGSGADGMTLVLADPSRGATPNSLGAHGGGLGFAGIPGLAAALDTYKNEVNPSNNFAGLSDGPTSTAEDLLHWLATANLTSPLENATNHIKVVTTSTTLTVFVNGTQVLSQAVTLPSSALLGFTGGTGGLNDRHAVANVIVNHEPTAPASLNVGVTVNAPAGSEQAATKLVVSGTCPSSFTTAPIGSEETATPTLNGAVAGAGCNVSEAVPAGGGGWTATASVNGGAPIALTALENKWTVPSFALGAGTNTVQFTNTYTPAPTVTAIKPLKGPASGGTTVTITGTNFTGATAVEFGSTNAASYAIVSSTSIKSVSPAASAGKVDVTVTTPGGTSALSTADQFQFGPPTVTGLSPTSGSTSGGTSVTVTGTGFIPGTSATTFKFGTKSATSVNCSSTTSCSVVAPSHAAGTVYVVATVSGMKSPKTAANQFTYS